MEQSQPHEHITRHERRLLRKQEEEAQKRQKQQHNTIKRWLLWFVVIIVVSGGIGLVVLGITAQKPIQEEDIVARRGLHWHPSLRIVIDGKEMELPKNLGASGAVHNPIHTHEDIPILHLEFQGRVVKDDLRVKKFFELWNKQFSANCILDLCNGPQGQVAMSVNGKHNTEFENYVMQDKDQIEIRYEELTAKIK